MANYHTPSDCGCSQNTSQCPMPEKPCSLPAPGRPMMQRPCPADMPKRPIQRPCSSDPLAGMPVGMAYVPWQCFHETFEVDKALQCGTIFPELSKPFAGKGGCPK